MTVIVFSNGQTVDLATYSDKRLLDLLRDLYAGGFLPKAEYDGLAEFGLLPLEEVYRCRTHRTFDAVYEEAGRRGLDLTNAYNRARISAVGSKEIAK